MAAAAANGYYGLSDRNLKIALLQLMCSGSTGGGGAVGGVTNGNGAPTAATTGNLYVQWDSIPPNVVWAKNQDGSWS